MAYIEAHQSLLTHRKTLRLARLLGLDRFAIVGRLLALWCWAIDNAPDGEICGNDADFLADVMGWEGEPQALCEALVTAGFLDTSEVGFVIHDWWSYGGKLIEKRRADAERKRVQRTSTARPVDVQRTSDGRHADVAGRVEKSRVEYLKRERDADASTPAPPPPATPPEKKTRGPDPLWDALVEEMKCAPGTEPERKSWNAALKFLRQAQATPEQMHARAALYRDRYGDERLTPHALVKHWNELTRPITLVPTAAANGGPANSNGSSPAKLRDAREIKLNALPVALN